MRRTEETRRVDVRELRRRGFLPDPNGNPDALVIRRLTYRRTLHDAPAYVRLDIGPETIDVTYPFRGKTVTGNVLLLRDTKNAARTFFGCPKCGGRRELLYLLDSIACRQCHRLRWTTNLLSPTDRAIHRCAKLQALTGVPPNLVGAFDGLAPFRPPWMTPARWARINAEYHAIAERVIGEQVAAAEASVAKLMKDIGHPVPEGFG